LVVGGQRIVDRQLVALGAAFDALIIVANDPQPWRDTGVPVVGDRWPDAGPLAGIEAALAHFASAGAESVVCVAGDMPFLQPTLLRFLRDAPDADAVVPRLAGLPQPLFARYATRLQPLVAARLAAGQRAVHRLFDEPAVKVCWLDEAALRAVDATLSSLRDVNTPADLDLLGAPDGP
jgi:molybdopterin-guanine dinucleotide biosynthesis protein A